MIQKKFAKEQALELMRDFSAFGNPLILLLLVFVFFGNFFLHALIGLVAVEVLGRLIKIIYFQHRPLKMKYSNLLEKSDAGSFPSLHAARIGFLFASIVSTDYSYVMKGTFLFLVLAVSASRLVLKKHRFVDVIFGILLGLAISVMVSFL